MVPMKNSSKRIPWWPKWFRCNALNPSHQACGGKLVCKLLWCWNNTVGSTVDSHLRTSERIRRPYSGTFLTLECSESHTQISEWSQCDRWSPAWGLQLKLEFGLQVLECEVHTTKFQHEAPTWSSNMKLTSDEAKSLSPESVPATCFIRLLSNLSVNHWQWYAGHSERPQ